MLKQHAHGYTDGKTQSWALKLGLYDIQAHILNSSVNIQLSPGQCVVALLKNEGENMISYTNISEFKESDSPDIDKAWRTQAGGFTRVHRASREGISYFITKQHLESLPTIYPIKWKGEFDGYHFMALNPQ